jgi:hypothetical protein
MAVVDGSSPYFLGVEIYAHKIYNIIHASLVFTTQMLQMFVQVWLQWFIWVKVELGAGLEDMFVKKSCDCLLNSFEAVRIQHLTPVPSTISPSICIKGKKY